MALINCPECNGNVSTAATTCPHCGFPLEKYIEEKAYNDEVERLTNKIRSCVFAIPEPRAKVCIKCGEPEDYNFKGCKCGFPKVEVDYPYAQMAGLSVDKRLYIFERCVVPRCIGDENSEEYISAKTKLYNRKAECEDSRKKSNFPNWKITPELPDPEYFGVKVNEKPICIESICAETKNEKPTLSCPICKSTNLSKISTAKKAAKISLFGIFGAGDVGKTYKCNKCGTKF